MACHRPCFSHGLPRATLRGVGEIQMTIPIRSMSGRMSSPRRGGEISLLVLHHTAGYWNGDLRTLRGLTERKASVHWLVGREPEEGIVAIVPEERAAWHAGKALWTDAGGAETRRINDISLGIELSRPPDCPPYTDFQYEACAQLCAYCMDKYPLITWERVVGHYQVSPGRKIDPNPDFDWERLREMVLCKPVKLSLDGEDLPDGLLADGTTLAPLRVIAEACGLEVDWDAGPPAQVELRRREGSDGD